nr:srsf protein kinase 3 [Quercus suber]
MGMLFHRPWPATSATVPQLDPLLKIEEEKTPYYHSRRFYPARLGDVFHGRYHIATKLGFGSSCTVWLARDLRRSVGMPSWLHTANPLWRIALLKQRYVAIKINASHDSGVVELSMLRRIQKTNPQHKGWHFVRKLVDFFTLDAADNSKHICLVFEPLREPLWLYCRRFVDRVIPPDIIEVILRMVLLGLDYLHSDCNIIHTGMTTLCRAARPYSP